MKVTFNRVALFVALFVIACTAFEIYTVKQDEAIGLELLDRINAAREAANQKPLKHIPLSEGWKEAQKEIRTKCSDVLSVAPQTLGETYSGFRFFISKKGDSCTYKIGLY